MKESPLILYIVHFIVCVTVMVMVSLEIRKYGTQDMLLCALKWFSLTAVIGLGLFLDDKIKKVKEESRKEKEGQYAGDRCRTEGWAGGKGKKRRPKG